MCLQAQAGIKRLKRQCKPRVSRVVLIRGQFKISISQTAAQKDCFSDLGVEKYEIVATLDTHTSDICRNLDGKHYPMSEYKAGVTAPPFHVYCRSTTAPYFDDDFGQIGQRAARNKDGKTYYVPDNMTYKEWYDKYVEHNNKMSSISNNWIGAEPIKHTKEELDELIKYAENKGIKLYKRREFDGDIDLLKAEIDTVYSLRKEYGITDPIMLGWKPMNANDFGETSKNHHEIWINELALRSREITEKNLSADNYLVANTAEGIAAHEMGHIISGKIKNKKTGLDIYKETVYNVSGKIITNDEALGLLFENVSIYSTKLTSSKNGINKYDEIIPEMLSIEKTFSTDYSSEFVRLLKEACGL